MEFLGHWGKQAAEGRCSEPEAYFATDGSGGMSIVRGKSDALLEISESDESLKLIEKGQMIVDDLKTHWYYTGQEQIQSLTGLFVEVGQDLGYM